MATMSFTSGMRIGPYEILVPLGVGGMGEVYKARDSRLGRLVAVKTLSAEKVADSEWRRRFLAEAQAASRLNHPNIVTIYEILEDRCSSPWNTLSVARWIRSVLRAGYL